MADQPTRGTVLAGQNTGPRVKDLPDILTGKAAAKNAGETPVIPLLLIFLGAYLIYFGVHYWRDQTVIWPSDPLKSILQGKGLPAHTPATPEGQVIQQSAGASGTGAGTPAGGSDGAALAKDEARYVGKAKYVWGGASPVTGWDCSGMQNYCIGHDLGLDIPGYPRGSKFSGQTHGPNVASWLAWPGAQKIGAGIFNPKDIQPGDLLCWGPNEHMGMAVNATTMIAAADPQQGTVEQPIAGNTGFFGFPPVILRLREFAQAPQGGSPAQNQQLAQLLAGKYGWSPSQDQGQWNALVALWNRESGWSTEAKNPSSGAYGIPQALPGSKMAQFGKDWLTSARVQIDWGLWYIKTTYGTPQAAWAHEQANGWY